jgi:hypothetical protein
MYADIINRQLDGKIWSIKINHCRITAYYIVICTYLVKISKVKRVVLLCNGTRS